VRPGFDLAQCRNRFDSEIRFLEASPDGPGLSAEGQRVRGKRARRTSVFDPEETARSPEPVSFPSGPPPGMKKGRSNGDLAQQLNSEIRPPWQLRQRGSPGGERGTRFQQQPPRRLLAARHAIFAKIRHGLPHRLLASPVPAAGA
jgi:hypothetical protein